MQTRLTYYASSKRARAILGQRRSTIDLRKTILDGGIVLVSTSQGTVGRDVAARIRAATSEYTVSAQQIAYGETEGHGKVLEYRRGVDDLKDGEAPVSEAKGKTPHGAERWKRKAQSKERPNEDQRR